MAKERLDVLLVQKGLTESREKAQRLIMAGQVLVGNEKIDNAYIDLNPNYLKSVIKLNISIPDISSSEIRNLITHNEKITGLLPREVEDYIYANELYKK